MDAAVAELGSNPVSNKHPIQREYGDEHADAVKLRYIDYIKSGENHSS